MDYVCMSNTTPLVPDDNTVPRRVSVRHHWGRTEQEKERARRQEIEMHLEPLINLFFFYYTNIYIVYVCLNESQ